MNRYIFQSSTHLSIVLTIAILLLLSTGCSKRYHNLPAFTSIPFSDTKNHSVGRFKTSYMADQINAFFTGSVNAPIAVSTFVDIDNLYASSTFGRILSEQLMSELAMRGYTVIEVRQSDAIQIMDGEGEFNLSRDSRVIRKIHDLSALVVGTYTVSPERVYLNARLIDPKTGIVMSVSSVEMPRTREISKLIRTNTLPVNLERMPVRQFGASNQPVTFTPNSMQPHKADNLDTSTGGKSDVMLDFSLEPSV